MSRCSHAFLQVVEMRIPTAGSGHACVMLRLPAAVAGLALLVPAPATAAPFGERPFRTVVGSADCLRATGAPGELMWSTDAAVRFLRAGESGLVHSGSLRADPVEGCPRVAVAGGVGVLAYVLGGRSAPAVFAHVREPGQGWPRRGTELPLGPAAGDGPVFGVPLAVAASPRGDAVVVAGSRGDASRVLVARRAPGAAFGTPETLLILPDPPGMTPPSVAAAMSAGGDAVVAWAVQRTPRAPREVWAATAPAFGAFGPPQRIGELRPGSPFSLAVAPDGRALLAFPSAGELYVAEREPGGAFAAAAPVGAVTERIAVLPAVAVRADGAALVAWTGIYDGMAGAFTRDGPGPFGPPVTLAARRPGDLNLTRRELAGLIVRLRDSAEEYAMPGEHPDVDGGNPRAMYAPDGRALVTWAANRGRGGVWSRAPFAALPAPLRRSALGSGLMDVESVTPLTLANGRPAIAWTTPGSTDRGRVHLAVAGAADAPQRPPPRVRVRAVGDRFADQPFRLRVTCSAACDVRAQIAGERDTVELFALPRAGRGDLTLPPSSGALRSVKVLLRYGAPGARRAAARTLTVRLRR
jgi:hypothetical protein